MHKSAYKNILLNKKKLNLNYICIQFKLPQEKKVIQYLKEMLKYLIVDVLCIKMKYFKVVIFF